MQCWTNVEDVGPTLYKCYTNVLRLLGQLTLTNNYKINQNRDIFVMTGKKCNLMQGFLSFPLTLKALN